MRNENSWMELLSVLMVVGIAAIVFSDQVEAMVGLSPPLLLGLVVAAAIGVAMLAGARGGRRRPLRRLIAVGTVLFGAIIVGAVLLGDRREPRIAGLLPATALLLFGLVGLGFGMVVGYLVLFERCVFGPKEERELAAIEELPVDQSPSAGSPSSGADER